MAQERFLIDSSMDTMFSETISFLQNKDIKVIDTGIILGTGLNDVLDHIEILQSIPYDQIPHFATSTVEFHKGNLIYGKMGNMSVVVMQGRFHHYEGYTMPQIVYPVRIMKLLGIRRLFISNAAGGINKDFKKGDLVIIDDHINLQTSNPLTGRNMDWLGSRFPDMSQPYSAVLNNHLEAAGIREHIQLKKGVYAAVNGPNLETRAEYRYLRIIGADMVGMSTVPEVIAANHMQLPCAAVAVITDECDPDNLKPISIDEIIRVAGAADKQLTRLFVSALAGMEKGTF